MVEKRISKNNGRMMAVAFVLLIVSLSCARINGSGSNAASTPAVNTIGAASDADGIYNALNNMINGVETSDASGSHQLVSGLNDVIGWVNGLSLVTANPQKLPGEDIMDSFNMIYGYGCKWWRSFEKAFNAFIDACRDNNYKAPASAATSGKLVISDTGVQMSVNLNTFVNDLNTFIGNLGSTTITIADMKKAVNKLDDDKAVLRDSVFDSFNKEMKKALSIAIDNILNRALVDSTTAVSGS